MDSPTLQFEGVTLQWPGRPPLLDRVQWDLARGSKLRVEGPSGQETTAFLKLCAGLIHPQTGLVRLGGEPVSPYHFAHPFLDRGALAWVPSGGGLLVNQSLLANVALPLRFVRGLSRAKADEAAQAWLERAGLGQLADRRPHALTPQERWLGALARAAASGAEFWLVDTPPGGLRTHQGRRAQEMLGPVLGDPALTVLLAEENHWLGDAPRGQVRLEAGSLAMGSAP